VIMTTYPNPFTGGNTIQYHVATAGQVVITLYDIEGRMVKTLVNQQQSPGDYTVEWNGSGLGVGTYFAKAIQSGNEQSLKLVKTN
jgi:flagellar hook assembly protein FlgD